MSTSIPSDGHGSGGVRPAAGSSIGSGSSMLVLMLATCIPNVLVNVNTSAMSVLLPDIAASTGSTIQLLQWTVSGYSLCAAASIVAAGSIGDRVGRRLVFTLGLIAFAICSVIVALAGSGIGVVAARSLQGLGAATVVAGSLVLLSVNLPAERRLFGTTMWGASAAIGTAIGPLVGGVFAQYTGWGGVFWFTAVLTALCVPAVLRRIPESTASDTEGSIDWAGVALIALSMSSIVGYATYGGMLGWLSGSGLAFLATIVASTVGFVALEARRAHPLVDLSLFKIAVFVGATAALVVFNSTLTAFIFGFQLFLQNPAGTGLTPLQSGAALLPVTIVVLGVSFIVTRIARRLGMRLTIAVGFAGLSIGYLMLAPIDPTWAVLTMLPSMFVIGIGAALANGPVTAVATGSVLQDQAGAASGVNNMARYVGAAISAPIATGLYTQHAINELEGSLASQGIADPDGTAEQLVNAGSSADLATISGVSGDALDSVVKATGDAIASGMHLLSIVLAVIACIGVLLAILTGRRHRREDEPFDAATAPAAVALTVARTELHGAPADA